MNHRLWTVCVAASTSLVASFVTSDAFACTQSVESFVTGVVPAPGSVRFPTDAPIVLDWVTIVDEVPLYESEYAPILDGIQEDTLSVTIHPFEDANQSLPGRLSWEEGMARFVFDEALEPDVRYIGEVSFGEGRGTIPLDFTTGAGALADVPSPDVYGGVESVVLTEVSYPIETCCPLEFPGQCGFERTCVQTGWGYDDVIRLDIATLADERLGSSAYRYEIYRHESPDEDIGELIRTFNPGTSRGGLASMVLDYRPSDGEPCFRAVARFVTGESLDSAKIVCLDTAQLVEIPRLDDPITRTLECDVDEPDLPNGEAGQEPDPEPVPEPEADRDVPAPADSMDEEGDDSDAGEDEAVDDSSCAVVVGDGGEVPGWVLLVALLLGVRRSRRLL